MLRTASLILMAWTTVELLESTPAQAQAKDGLKFEIYQDAAKEYRWRLRDADGKVLATAGEGYTAKASAKRSVTLLQTEAAGKLAFEVYEDKAKQFRWRAKSGNGQIVAASASGYKDKADCEKVVERIKKEAAKAAVEELK